MLVTTAVMTTTTHTVTNATPTAPSSGGLYRFVPYPYVQPQHIRSVSLVERYGKAIGVLFVELDLLAAAAATIAATAAIASMAAITNCCSCSTCTSQ